MKKVISFVLIGCMCFGQAIAFADTDSTAAESEPAVVEEQPAAETEDEAVTEETEASEAEEAEAIEEEIAQEDEAVSESDAEALAEVADDEQILEEDSALAEDIDAAGAITEHNLKDVIKKIYRYLVERDRYYKKVLITLKRIENSGDPALMRKALNVFDREFDRQVEKDKRIHHKIQMVNAYLKEHRDDLTPKEKLAINQIYKPMVIKYNEHRRMLAYIHRWIERLQDKAGGEYSDKLLKAGDAFLMNNAGKAKQYYQLALETGALDKNEKQNALNKLEQLEGEKNRVFVNNKRLALDTEPVNVNGRMLVPVRAIADSLGAEVSWNAATQTATIVKGDRTVTITINKGYLTVNGDKVSIDVPAKIVNGRTMLPLRAISEALQTTVDYEPQTGTVSVDEDNSDATLSDSVDDFTDTGLVEGDDLSDKSVEEIVNDVENATDSGVEDVVQTVE